jgi:hypothetical protein
MTGSEVALIITAVGTFTTSLGSVIVSLRNSRKIDEVHRTTNSLAKRNEEIARQLGRADEKANPT